MLKSGRAAADGASWEVTRYTVLVSVGRGSCPSSCTLLYARHVERQIARDTTASTPGTPAARSSARW